MAATNSRLLSSGMGRRAPWAPRIGTYPLPATQDRSLLEQLVEDVPPLGQEPPPFVQPPGEQPPGEQPAAPSAPQPSPVMMGSAPLNEISAYGPEGIGGSPDASFGLGEPSPNQSLSGVVDAASSVLGLMAGGPIGFAVAPAIMGTLAQRGATQPTMGLTSAIAQIMGYPTVGQMVQDWGSPVPTVRNPVLTDRVMAAAPMNTGMIGAPAGPNIGPTPGFGGGVDAFGQPSLDPGVPTGLTENEAAAMAAQMGRGGMTAGTFDDVGRFGAPRGAMSLADAIGAGLVDPGSELAAGWGGFANDPGGGEIPGVFGGFIGSVPSDYRGGMAYGGLNTDGGAFGGSGMGTGPGGPGAGGLDGFGGGGDWMTGGYTGAGADGVVQPDMRAGVVHEGEGVLNARAMEHYGDAGRRVVAALNARSVPRTKLEALVGKR